MGLHMRTHPAFQKINFSLKCQKRQFQVSLVLLDFQLPWFSFQCQASELSVPPCMGGEQMPWWSHEGKDHREFSVERQSSKYTHLVGSSKCRFLGQPLDWGSVGGGQYPGIWILMVSGHFKGILTWVLRLGAVIPKVWSHQQQQQHWGAC